MSMPVTGAIIQARVGSTRLPGKILRDIGGRSMLERVVRRARRARRLDVVAVATSDLPADDATVAEANRLGVEIYRGDEQDVLGRYCEAARRFGLDVVARITSDCPLIDAEVIDVVVERFHEAHPPPDYVSNTLERTWPRGLDVAVMSRTALERAASEARKPYERVHVTPYLREHPELFRLLPVTGGAGVRWRWTVDTREDLEFVRAVYACFDNEDVMSWRDVMALLAREPGLAALNSGVRQKDLEDL